MQIIYAVSQQHGFVFPKGFSKQIGSNKLEKLKLIDEIINPYVVNKRKGPPYTSIGYMRCQMTDTAKSKLTSLSTELYSCCSIKYDPFLSAIRFDCQCSSKENLHVYRKY